MKWLKESDAHDRCGMKVGDSGQVSSVVFEPTGALPQTHYRASSGGSIGASSSSLKRSKAKDTSQTRMACGRNELVAASVFHDVGDDPVRVQAYIDEIVAEFHKQYKDQLISMRQAFDDYEDRPTSSTLKPIEILTRFKDFEAIADHASQRL
eukprot:TRINITY_DN2149_c0_g1_i4.p1 TRINITY_DN2149_c0_g1~~TRINITY_DN2149_c0_g1_i4.p1  ORF type:complete len:152 (-),score=25.05 TRINITY_DN2149_c0_g1_i4:21-476(-)